MGSRSLMQEGDAVGWKRSGYRTTCLQTVRFAVALALIAVVSGGLAAVAGAYPAASAQKASLQLAHSVRSLNATRTAAAVNALPSSVQLYQWETDPSGNWITGNLGDHNSAYEEGQVIPFRLDVSGIAAGDYSFAVCRDFTDGGTPTPTYGYLKLAPFETDYTTDAGSTTTFGVFNATSGVSSLVGTDTGAQGGCNAGHVETDVTFHTTGATSQFIYWGGYLAAPLDAVPAPGSGTVQFQHSAGFYPGSSLHMVLLDRKSVV